MRTGPDWAFAACRAVVTARRLRRPVTSDMHEFAWIVGLDITWGRVLTPGWCRRFGSFGGHNIKFKKQL